MWGIILAKRVYKNLSIIDVVVFFRKTPRTYNGGVFGFDSICIRCCFALIRSLGMLFSRVWFKNVFPT